MKISKLFLFILIVVISILKTNAAGFNSVFSKDGIDVWAVGNAGNVFRSSDGGNTWQNVVVGTANYNSVFAINQTIWIAGDGDNLEISTNNGTSWTLSNIANGNNLKCVFFIDANTGWICGGNGTILKTTNGGVNWSLLNSTAPHHLYCIKFADNNTGTACGYGGEVVTTTNGGAAWSLSATPVSQDLLSIDIKSNTIICSGLNSAIIKSTNLGSSWSIIDYKMATVNDVNSVYLSDVNTYYSVGGGGFIRKSTDGGSSFTWGINPMLADLKQIYFSGNMKGFACGRDNNIVINTTDGGNTWQMPPGTTQSFTWALRLTTDPRGSWGSTFALSKLNPSEIFVVANLHLNRSLDFGQTWQQISSTMPGGNAPHALVISPKDSNKMIAAYDTLFNSPPYNHGYIFTTTNYGNTWLTTVVQDIDVDSNPLAIDFDHPDTVYLGLTDSLVLRSTNFGLTWAPAGPAHLGKICSIVVVKGHSNILIAGSANYTSDSAFVYRSTDYGVSWNTISSFIGNTPEIPCIAPNPFVPDKFYQAAFFSNPGGLYISTNDGLTWTLNYANGQVWGIAVANDDPNLITWGYGGGTGIYLTVNGGTNWFPIQSAPSAENQSMLSFNRKLIFTQQNHAIYQLMPSYSLPIGIIPISTEVPKQFSLEQNYPNPFNPETKIRFDIPPVENGRDRTVILIIYNAIGQEITTLVNEQLKSGIYEVTWNAANYPSGVYFYKLETGDTGSKSGTIFSESKKLILLK